MAQLVRERIPTDVVSLDQLRDFGGKYAIATNKNTLYVLITSRDDNSDISNLSWVNPLSAVYSEYIFGRHNEFSSVYAGPVLQSRDYGSALKAALDNGLEVQVFADKTLYNRELVRLLPKFIK